MWDRIWLGLEVSTILSLTFPSNQLCELAPHVVQSSTVNLTVIWALNPLRDGLRGPTGLILTMNWHLELSVLAEILRGFNRGRVASQWLHTVHAFIQHAFKLQQEKGSHFHE